MINVQLHGLEIVCSTGQINIKFLFFCIFLNITFGFFIIVAYVNIVLDEVRVHWKAYSISYK